MPSRRGLQNGSKENPVQYHRVLKRNLLDLKLNTLFTRLVFIWRIFKHFNLQNFHAILFITIPNMHILNISLWIYVQSRNNHKEIKQIQMKLFIAF